MENVLAFLKGKKTYLVMAIIVGLAIYEAQTQTEIPEVVFLVLAGLGLGTLGAKVDRLKADFKDD